MHGLKQGERGCWGDTFTIDKPLLAYTQWTNSLGTHQRLAIIYRNEHYS